MYFLWHDPDEITIMSDFNVKNFPVCHKVRKQSQENKFMVISAMTENITSIRLIPEKSGENCDREAHSLFLQWRKKKVEKIMSNRKNVAEHHDVC